MDWRVRFSLYSSIPHLFSNISDLIPLCRIYVQVAYPLLVLLTLKSPINMSFIKYWVSPMYNLPLIYQDNESTSHLYTGQLEMLMEFCSQQYCCNDENLSFSYTSIPLNNSHINFLMDPNQIHLIGEYFASHGTHLQWEVV